MLDFGAKAHPGILPPIDLLALARVPMVLTFERLASGLQPAGRHPANNHALDVHEALKSGKFDNKPNPTILVADASGRDTVQSRRPTGFRTSTITPSSGQTEDERLGRFFPVPAGFSRLSRCLRTASVNGPAPTECNTSAGHRGFRCNR